MVAINLMAMKDEFEMDTKELGGRLSNVSQTIANRPGPVEIEMD